MIYFTSDTHFGHANVIRLCNRPFNNINEMNNVMIANWNAKITNGDHIYILGDMFFRTNDAEQILSRLKGKKHLILGNHDRDWIKKVDLNKYFESVDNLLFLSDGKHKLTLCHYPMMTWPQANRECYMVFGHIHADTNADYWPLIQNSDQMLNAGVDVNNYVPVTFDELVLNNTNHKIKDSSQKAIQNNNM